MGLGKNDMILLSERIPFSSIGVCTKKVRSHKLQMYSLQ